MSQERKGPVLIKTNGNGNGHELKGAVDLSAGEEAKKAIRYAAENNPTWANYEKAKFLWGWTDIFRDRLLDPIARLDRQGRLPGPALGFEVGRVNNLAYYRLGKNAFGLDDEIILNELYLDRPQYSILETLFHEQLHLYQQRFGEHPVKPDKRGHIRDAHNKEFREMAAKFGLHVTPQGCHDRPADGLFEQLLGEYGIRKPEWEIPEATSGDWWEMFGGGRKKGRSTLHLWECPGCGLKVRSGVSRDIQIACVPCTREKEVTVLFVRRG